MSNIAEEELSRGVSEQSITDKVSGAVSQDSINTSQEASTYQDCNENSDVLAVPSQDAEPPKEQEQPTGTADCIVQKGEVESELKVGMQLPSSPSSSPSSRHGKSLKRGHSNSSFSQRRRQLKRLLLPCGSPSTAEEYGVAEPGKVGSTEVDAHV